MFFLSGILGYPTKPLDSDSWWCCEIIFTSNQDTTKKQKHLESQILTWTLLEISSIHYHFMEVSILLLSGNLYNIAVENHHVSWENRLFLWAIVHSYVSLPEGTYFDSFLGVSGGLVCPSLDLYIASLCTDGCIQLGPKIYPWYLLVKKWLGAFARWSNG